MERKAEQTRKQTGRWDRKDDRSMTKKIAGGRFLVQASPSGELSGQP